MKFSKAIKDYFTLNKVEEAWKKRGAKVSHVQITFDNGVIRTLEGEAAEEWAHDLHREANGMRIDWKKHKWSSNK